MTRYVLDAPTLLWWVDADKELDPAHQLVAPAIIRSQALALLLASVRQGSTTRTQAIRTHELLTEVKIRLLGDRMSRRTALTIALEQGWDTTYDAEYVAVTRLQADALVTVDRAFADRVTGLVPIVGVEALTTGPAGGAGPVRRTGADA